MIGSVQGKRPSWKSMIGAMKFKVQVRPPWWSSEEIEITNLDLYDGSGERKVSKLDLDDGCIEVKWSKLDLPDWSNEAKKIQVEPPWCVQLRVKGLSRTSIMGLVMEKSSSFTTMMDSVKGKMSKLDLNDGSGEGKRSNLHLHDGILWRRKVQVGSSWCVQWMGKGPNWTSMMGLVKDKSHSRIYMMDLVK